MWHLWHPQVLLFTGNCSPIHHHRLLGGQKILDDLDLMCTSYFHWLISCSTMWGPWIGVFSITKRKSFPYKELDRGPIGETGGYAKTFRHGPSCNSSQNLCVLLAVALGEIWGINIINAITILFARSSGIWKHEIVIRLQTAPIKSIGISEERKCQYSAMRRAIFREATPELVAKFTLSSDKERFLIDFSATNWVMLSWKKCVSIYTWLSWHHPSLVSFEVHYDEAVVPEPGS